MAKKPTAQGKIAKEYVFNAKNIKGKIKGFQFNTNTIIKINEDEFFFEFFKGNKEDVFLKVNFN